VKWELANYQRIITVILFIPVNYAGYAWFERNNDNYAFAVPVKYGEKKMETPETPVMIIPDEPVYVDENDPDEDDALRGGAVPPVSAAVPASADTSGSWEQTADGSWSYVKDGSAVSDSWLLIANTYADPAAGQKPYGWFRFDGAGKMLTGWYTDTDGSIYYLNPAADGTKGQMLTGWREIGGKWYYFSEAEGSGRLGALLTNTRTPDGYRVGADGAWDGAAPVR